jgi:hypothetical protein
MSSHSIPTEVQMNRYDRFANYYRDAVKQKHYSKAKDWVDAMNELDLEFAGIENEGIPKEEKQ